MYLNCYWNNEKGDGFCCVDFRKLYRTYDIKDWLEFSRERDIYIYCVQCDMVAFQLIEIDNDFKVHMTNVYLLYLI